MNEVYNGTNQDKNIYPDRSGMLYEPQYRSSAELNQLLENQDKRKEPKDILDEAQNKLCVVDYDSENNDLVSIHTEPYTNTEGTAERLEERIYVTNDDGQVTNERLTRAEAREQEKRYLIVTNLLFHGDDMLIQKRSADKKIDPGKVSTSAHGVAKEVFSQDGSRITNAQEAALINSALEINEELRHSAEPFNIRIWPGSHNELMTWAEDNKIDDPNTIWLVPEKFLPDDGYPLGSWHDKRTRALSAGFVFSKDEPMISIDKNELEESKWQKVSDVFKEPNAANDLPDVSIAVIEEILKDSSLIKKYGKKLGENLIRRYKGLDIDKP